jgi:hypothetical protein
MEKITKGEDMAKIFALFCNSFTPDISGFVKSTMTEHRTLQQTMMRVFIATIEQWAKNYDTGRYDARNEATCKMAKQIWEIIKDNPYLPFV